MTSAILDFIGRTIQRMVNYQAASPILTALGALMCFCAVLLLCQYREDTPEETNEGR